MRPFAQITESLLLPRVISLTPNLYAAAFTLMKLVPARHILLAAEAEGQLGPSTRIVETTSGTFGLALAMQASLMRRPLTLVSDPVIDDDLRRRLVDLGSQVVICEQPASEGGYQEARLRKVAEIMALEPDSFCPEQYRNPQNPAAYEIVAAHLLESLGTVDCLLGPVGSGGSMCGTTTALRRHGETEAVGIDTHGSVLFGPADSHRQLRGLGNSLIPPVLDHRVFDEVHWVSAAEAYAATRQLHQRHALFQGPTSGAAYLAARWWAARNPDARCVVLLPDEGYRYQRTVYDDDWLGGQGPEDLQLASEPVDVSDPEPHSGRWSRLDWGRRPLAAVRGLVGAGP